MLLILKCDVAQGKVVTYGRFVVGIRPNKTYVHRGHITMGSNLIQYPVGVSMRSTDLTTGNSLMNSTISTASANYMCFYVKNLPQMSILNT
jgi:hypothetical protein